MTAVDEPAISPENARFRRGISPRNSSFARFFQRNEDETPSSFPPSLFFALSIPLDSIAPPLQKLQKFSSEIEINRAAPTDYDLPAKSSNLR